MQKISSYGRGLVPEFPHKMGVCLSVTVLLVEKDGEILFIYIYIYIYIYIQGVPRVKVTTSGECSLGQTIPI